MRESGLKRKVGTYLTAAADSEQKSKHFSFENISNFPSKRKSTKLSEKNMSLSEKSQIQYEIAWKKFVKFLSNGAGIETEPKSEDYLTYFDFLKVVKNLKGVTIWSIYAKLNSVHYQKYGTKLSEDHILVSTLKVSFLLV